MYKRINNSISTMMLYQKVSGNARRFYHKVDHSAKRLFHKTSFIAGKVGHGLQHADHALAIGQVATSGIPQISSRIGQFRAIVAGGTAAANSIERVAHAADASRKEVKSYLAPVRKSNNPVASLHH